MMDRRVFITAVAGSIVAAPLRVGVQAGKLCRIGYLATDGAASSPLQGAFLKGLRELGYVEDQNVVIEYRLADGRTERLSDLASELVRLGVDVIVTSDTPAALGAKQVTATIPIVMASGDAPVFYGLVASLARPGGNVTGLYRTAAPELGGKQLRLLKEVVPGVSRVSVLLDSGDAYALLMMREIEKVAQSIGVHLHSVKTQRPEEFERAFEAALLDRVDALMTVEGGQTLMARTQIVNFAAMSRLPAIYGLREFVDAGGLIAYGPNNADLFRRAAIYVDKILKGAKPADLPVEQPTKFELVINLKTAKALGLTIPQSILIRADEVIQ
jgi:putative tryptophan/tyrosine transport system substrate-binding protein